MTYPDLSTSVLLYIPIHDRIMHMCPFISIYDNDEDDGDDDDDQTNWKGR